MFWADKAAQELKKRKLLLEWVDDMKTPSGRVHVGALRGVVVHDLVFKTSKELSIKTKFTYVFEDHDPMDDIPAYLPREKFEPYLGMPLFKVPSPEKGHENYARFYASEFQKVFEEIGCHPDILWTKDLYTSGKMNSVIKECLDNAKEIRKIYEELYKKSIPVTWFPFQVYCPECGKVSTTNVSAWNGEKVTWKCQTDRVTFTKGCGSKGVMSPFSDEKGIVGKLPWKVEWAAKWKAIGVTVEGAGKDHMSKGGSHDLASEICKRVLNYEVPYPIAYEWFLIGGRKMSSSRGVGSSAAETLEILPPELLRFLMVKTNIREAINFDPSGDTIPRLFDEYQEYADHYFGNKKDDYARIFELSQVGNIKKPPKVRFSILVQWVQMPDMRDKIEKEKLEQWVPYVQIWLDRYAPESERFVVQKEVPKNARNLSSSQKEYLKKVSELIGQNLSAEILQTRIYELAKELGISSKDAFGAVYMALLGKDHGPKAAWLISSLDRGFVKERFSNI